MRYIALVAAMIGPIVWIPRPIIAGEIHEAVNAHDTDRVARILKTNPDAVRERDLYESTPLHYAVRDAGLTKVLLQHGADPNARDKAGKTPLSCTPTVESATLLINAGASLKVKDAYGYSPLHWATVSDFEPDLASLLLRRGANVEYRDDNGRTALMTAVVHGSDRVLLLLLNSHGDIEARDNEGRTPLFCAAIRRTQPSSSINTMKLLVDHGAKVDVQDNSGNTLLHVACALGYPDSVKWLLEHGANVNATNRDGLTPLAECERARRMEWNSDDHDRLDEIIVLLKSHGAPR